jgi:hypothetical protein
MENNTSLDLTVLTADDLMFEELEERMAPAVLPISGSSTTTCSTGTVVES